MIVTPTAVATISATVIPTARHIATVSFSQGPSLFDLLSLFFGGAFGAIVVLGIDKWWDHKSENKKQKEEVEQITNALKLETENNIKICVDILKGYRANPGKLFPYHHSFSISYLELYKSKCIDFSKEDDSAKYKDLEWFSKQISAIEDQRKNMQLFDAFSQVTLLTLQVSPQSASHNHLGIVNYNTSISVMVNELMAKLIKFDI